MPELYFRPLACSLASRIALLEAGIEARYHRVDLESRRLVDGDADYYAVSPKGQVPALRLDDGSLLTEGAAVLQYIADLRPESGLAPSPDHPERYRLQEWLSFVGTEIHKAFLYPMYNSAPEEVRTHARASIEKTLAIVAAHLEHHSYLVGERFTVADAYLIWALVLVRALGVKLAPSLSAYARRLRERPSVREALACESAMLPAQD
jgi:glutathione S-transferase